MGCAILSVSTLGYDVAFFVGGRLFLGKDGGTVRCGNVDISMNALV